MLVHISDNTDNKYLVLGSSWESEPVQGKKCLLAGTMEGVRGVDSSLAQSMLITILFSESQI